MMDIKREALDQPRQRLTGMDIKREALDQPRQRLIGMDIKREALDQPRQRLTGMDIKREALDRSLVRLPGPAGSGITMSVRRIITAALVLAPVAHAGPQITEVAWAGSDASANDEWVEVFNPGPDAICDLGAFALVQGTTERRLPVGRRLAANEIGRAHV